MRTLFRHAVSSLLIVAASNAAAGVITQDGVVFTSSFTGNVLTLEIDAAGRSGGWAGASAIDALALKTIGSFGGVSMTSSTGAAWSLIPAELKASGCGAAKAGAAATSLTRLCYTGPGVALADNMLFTFTFTGTPALEAPHLKVHFVDAKGNKVGSLLSLDFPAQAASTPVGAAAGAAGSTPVTGSTPAVPPAGSSAGQAGSSGAQGGTASTAPELIPAPVLTQPVASTPVTNGSAGSLPASLPDEDDDAELPEPRQLALMTAGLAMLGLTRRRRK